MKLGKVILLSLLAVISVTSFYTFVDEGPRYIGKSYFDSDQFQHDIYNYQNLLVPLIIATPDPEELKKEIRVTSSEIEEHRFRYGNLASQLESIRMQYEGVKEQALIDERDKKIKDITRNFQDDQYVEAKIRADKEKEIDAYFASLEREKKIFQNRQFHLVYELKNIETGEEFSNGSLDTKLAYKKVYSSKNGYLNESPIYYNLEYSDSLVNIINHQQAKFSGTVAVTEESALSSGIGEEYKNFVQKKWMFYGILIGGVVAAILFVTLYRRNKTIFDYKLGQEKYQRLPIDVRIASLIISVFFAITLTKEFIWSIFYSYGRYDVSVISLVIAVALGTISLYQWEWLRKGFDWRDWKDSWSLGALKGLREFFLNRSIAIQILFVLVVVFFWGFGTVLLFLMPEAIFIWIAASLFIGLPTLFTLLSKVSYLNRVIAKSDDMAKGNVGTETEVKGRSAIARLAANLNQLRGRVQTSQSEQVKSERLKTELITNVSHDLRTPLTSIITYTDLLKNPNITEEERASYIEILDKKSMRLKTLIEDLFEVSKMASGNIELDKRKIDLTQLLQQAIAEHQEDIDKQGLDFRVIFGTKPIMAYVDGQKWWRMLDNLIVNTLKYALPNTRVYINLDQDEHEAVFVIKNIAKYELGNDEVDELTERFKRADTSRHTDGSGLGLAIAQSIVDLHGGSLNIEVDGDLFKVTVRVLAAT